MHQIARNPVLAQEPPLPDLRDLAVKQANFYHLSDRAKWQSVLRSRARGTAPSQSIHRATSLSGHHLHLGRAASGLSFNGDQIWLELNGRPEGFDHVIAGTGYRQGAELRPEFAALAPLIEHWRDHGFPAAPEQAHWGDLPKLGEGFQLLPKTAGDDWVSRIHVYTFAAILSHGLHVGDIASAAVAVPRLTRHIARRLFEAARPAHEAETRGFEPSLLEQSA